MDEKLSYALAAKILVVVPCLLIIFHLCNLLGFVPLNIVWTGRVSSSKAFFAMGILSIVLNIAYMWFGLVRGKTIDKPSFQTFANRLYPFLFWWLVGNSIANLFSKSRFEVFVFTPVLILLTICCYRVRSERGITV